MTGGQVKTFLYINRRAPHGTNYAQEGLEVALIGAAFDQNVLMVFMDDGVFQLRNNQNTHGIGTKNFSATFCALGDYGISRIYIEKESLVLRGMTIEDVMPLVYEDEAEEWKEKSLICVITSSELSEIIATADVVLSF